MSTVCPKCFVDYDEGDYLIEDEFGKCYHLDSNELESAANDWAREAANGVSYVDLDPFLRAIVSDVEYDTAREAYDGPVWPEVQAPTTRDGWLFAKEYHLNLAAVADSEAARLP